MVVVTKPDPALIFEAITKHKGQRVLPAAHGDLQVAGDPGIEKIDMSPVKYLMYGAAPMSVETQESHRFVGPIMAGGYGQTEAPPALPTCRRITISPTASSPPMKGLSSVGRPNPLIRVEMMNDDSEILPGAKPGICVRGDLVMKGYYKHRTRPPKPSSTVGCIPAISATS